MAKGIDLVGHAFGRLVVVELVGSGNSGRLWRCECECGGRTEARTSDLRRGKVKSCGCMHPWSRNPRIGNRKHGEFVGNGHGSPEYGVWAAMLRRCNDPSDSYYHRYGGRGILVCEGWNKSFGQFLSDVGRRPSKGYSLDRIETDGHYEPGNVKWSSPKEQARNRSTNRHLTLNGTTKTMAEWAEVTGLHHQTICSRLRRGWSVEAALCTSCRRGAA